VHQHTQSAPGTNTILQRGVPNIIVSASEELLLHHLITLYEKHAHRTPYPYEVLFCEESTPFEEIELLLRRYYLFFIVFQITLNIVNAIFFFFFFFFNVLEWLLT
jgi:hypothetical protein